MSFACISFVKNNIVFAIKTKYNKHRYNKIFDLFIPVVKYFILHCLY